MRKKRTLYGLDLYELEVQSSSGIDVPEEDFIIVQFAVAISESCNQST